MSSLAEITIRGMALLHAIPDDGAARAETLPLLFIHGMWGRKEQFTDWLRWLADHGYEAYAVDLPGHGGSTPDIAVGSTSIKTYVQALEDLLVDIGECHVIGHSMGGLILQKLCATNWGRKRIKKAVLLCSAAPAGIPIFGTPIFRRMPRYFLQMLLHWPFKLTREDADALLFNRISCDVERADLYAKLVPESGRAAADMALWQVWVNKPLPCPTLVVAAEHDQTTPPDIQCRVAAKLQVPYTMLRNFGHMMQLEDTHHQFRAIAFIVKWLDTGEIVY